MADSMYESVWKLMSKYTFEYSDSIHGNLTCGICEKLVMDAYQTLCGCQYCHRCLVTYLADGARYCLGVKEGCKEEKLILNRNVIKNSFLNKKILTIKVLCPHPSCTCNIILPQMEDHMRVCTKRQITCPFVQIGCDNDGESKDGIVTHLQSETLTHSQLLLELIHNLKNEVDGLKDKFQISQLEISTLRENLTLKDEKINDMVLQVNDQNRKMIEAIEKQNQELKCFKEELKDNTNVMMILKEELGELNKYWELKLPEMIEGKIEAKIGDQRREIESIKVASRRKEVEIKTEMELRLSEISRETREREDTFQTQMKVRRQSRDDVVNEKKEKCYLDIERIVDNLVKCCPRVNADFVWRIDECSKKRKIRILSESFHSNNYKLCLSANAGGDDIDLRCRIMRGNNDDRVQWPMRLSVTLGIFNQDTLRIHASGTTQYDVHKYDKSAFERPKRDMNECGICVDPFIKYSFIKHDKSITVDDSIIVCCVLGDSR